MRAPTPCPRFGARAVQERSRAGRDAEGGARGPRATPGERRARLHPHLQRGARTSSHSCTRVLAAGADARRPGRRRRQPGRHRRRRRRARRAGRRASTCCTAPRRPASAPRTSPAFAWGARPRLRRRWSRWTPTGRTARRTCRACSSGSRRRRPRARLALGAGRPRRELAAAPRDPVAAAATPTPRLALRIARRDATGGFRAFRASALRALDLDASQSQGYCFQVDLLLAGGQGAPRVLETPITFVERALGASKMSGNIVVEALWRTTVWGIQDRLRRSRPSEPDSGI